MLKGMDPTSHGIVLEKVLDLCGKRDRWSIAYRHPDGHRTSNMLDRLMRGRNRSFDRGQHLDGSREACPALSRVGVVVELHTLAPGDDAEEPRLAVPRRTSQPAPVSRLLAAKPVDLRVPWWIPMSTPTKSVTVSMGCCAPDRYKRLEAGMLLLQLWGLLAGRLTRL